MSLSIITFCFAIITFVGVVSSGVTTMDSDRANPGAPNHNGPNGGVRLKRGSGTERMRNATDGVKMRNGTDWVKMRNGTDMGLKCGTERIWG